MTDKKLDKISDILGLDFINQINNTSVEDLKTLIVEASQSIRQATEELESNPAYQDLKENLKALYAGLKDVKKRQNAIIQYSLHLTSERGKI